MEDFHKFLLIRNRVRLVTDLQPDLLVNYMIQDGIMTPNDLEMIDSKPTRMKKNEYFLDTLPTRGPKAFACFLGALYKMEDPLHTFLVEQAQNPYEGFSRQQMGGPHQDSTDAPSPMDTSRTFPTPVQEEADQQNIAQHVRYPDRRVTEMDLNTISANMGLEWRSFMRSLGLKENEIFHATSQSRSERDKIFSCFVKWRQREGVNATVTALVQKMQENEIDIEVYECLSEES